MARPDLFAQRTRSCRVEFGEVNFVLQQTMLSH
jgi:hypothetical protein